MPVTTTSQLPIFELALDEALEAPTAHHFLNGVRSGYKALYESIVADPRNRKRGLDALDAFFAANNANVRRRRVAELCAWSIFDKPALPTEKDALPEFLWLFAMPFLVTFSAEQLTRPVLLEGPVFDADALLTCAEEAEVFNENGYIRAFSTMLRRDDLHAYGPRGLASTFVTAELGGDEVPQPLPLLMDEDIESHRTVVYFVPCAARLPAGTQHLINKDAVWCDQEAARIIREGLEMQGLELDNVRSLPPCPMSEIMLYCSGSGLAELESNLARAKQVYGELKVVIKYPMEGFAEINALNNEGQEIMLLPAFAFVEPQGELRQVVNAICEQHDIPFKGSFTPAFTGSRLIH
jgi:hypothetical protein